jgi:hypothetical protein
VTATDGRRSLLALAFGIVVALASLARGHAADDRGMTELRGGIDTIGPPAPAVPGIAATPAPAAEPALPNAPLEPGVAAREPEPEEAPPPDAKPRRVNLWPLLQYDSDPAARTSRLRLFGALVEYRADAARQAFFFRPFVSIDQSRVGHDDHVSFLGPVLRSYWGQTEQWSSGFGGLFTYRTRTSEDGRTLTAQHVKLLPVYFYDWERPEPQGRISVAPLYVDLEDFLGYERIETVLFPAYVRLKTPTLDRYYYPYPIIRRDGPEGSGYRLWPFPLRDRHGHRLERTAADPTDHDDPERLTYFPLWRDELDATDRTADPS